MVLTRPTVDRDPDEHACGVDRHVERSRVPAADEMLVHLVGRGVRDRGERRRAGRPSARRSNAPRIPYSVAWASLRRTRSQVPSPVLRFGIDESVKISAAQATTGSQSASVRERVTLGC